MGSALAGLAGVVVAGLPIVASGQGSLEGWSLPTVEELNPGPERRSAPSPTPNTSTPRPSSGGTMRAGRTFRDCPDCPEMVVIPPGTFMMGSTTAERQWAVSNGGKEQYFSDESPQHLVTIEHQFAVGKYEVTRGEYAVFARDTGRDAGEWCQVLSGGKEVKVDGRTWQSPGFFQTDDHPVVCVTWKDAVAYTAWLSRRTGQHYRLLTEAEWEYAARAGTTGMRYWGDDKENGTMCRFGNFRDQTFKDRYMSWSHTATCRDGHIYTAPVGSFRVNAFGLHDMFGNVHEIAYDCYHDTYQGAPSDGAAWTAGECNQNWRVRRGGAWRSKMWVVRSAYRNWAGNIFRGDDLGFRVARSLR